MRAIYTQSSRGTLSIFCDNVTQVDLSVIEELYEEECYADLSPMTLKSLTHLSKMASEDEDDMYALFADLQLKMTQANYFVVAQT